MKNLKKRLLIVLLGTFFVVPQIVSALLPRTAEAKLAASRSVAYIAPDRFIEKGLFEVYILHGKSWLKTGDAQFDEFFREKTVDLGDVSAYGREVRIRLVQKGGGAAHIDSARLGVKAPIGVRGTGDKDALRKLASREFDVVDVFGKTVELVFPGGEGDGKLNLFARVEGVINHGIPFRFPAMSAGKKISGDSFYTYLLDSRRIGPGGSGRSMEKQAPFLKEFCISGTGHPSDYLFGWVGNDDRNLYVRIDFVGDNTKDGDKDYTKITVSGPDGIKEFKISEAERKWGRPGFTYTDKASYRHKVYDLSIPFEAMGFREKPRTSVPLRLAFEAYGTDGYGLLLVTTSPVDGAVNVPVDTVISATFNDAVDPDTVNSDTFEVRRTSDWSLIAGNLELSSDNTVVSFTPNVYLSQDTNYTVTLIGGGIQALVFRAAPGQVPTRAVAFNGEDLSWNFTTGGFDLRRDGLGDGMNIINCGTVFDVDGKGGSGPGPWSGAALFTLYFALFLFPVWILKRLHGTKRSFARPALLSLLVVLALVLVAALPASAGELVPKAQRFHPTSDGFGTLTLDSDQVLGNGDWAFVSTLNYASRPLNVGDVRNLVVQRDRVRDLITLDLAGAYGVCKNLQFGIDVPINMLIEGRNSLGQQGSSYTLGDIRLNGKWQFLSRPDYGLAFVPFFYIPMGNKEFLLTEDRYGWGGKLAGHWAQSERLTLVANLGLELISSPFRSRIFSSWLQYGIGMDYKLATKGASIVAEINGETTLDKMWDHTNVSPFELLAAYRKQWTPGWTYEVGMGLGLNKGMGAPAYRGLVGVSYLFGAPKAVK